MASEGFDVDLLVGWAQFLGAAGIGVWHDSGVYAAGEIGIVLGVLPQSPDRVVTLSTYGVTDDPALSDSVIGLQVTTRCGGQDPRETARLTAGVFNALHGLTHTNLPTGVHVVQCLRRSWTSLGQDSNNRWRSVQNFYVDVHRPTLNRI